jgi:peptidoglycan/LPS O-acetylase OafA/YrhL
MTTYRPEIDGLRALAVMSVVLFHAGLPGIGGGFMGVDVFFVISGFLITSIILAELSTGRFSFSNFYARRARRILPLMIVVCAVTAPLALTLMLPDDLKDYGVSLVGAATFTLNLIAANNVGYFDRAAEAQPLLHIWSLAVEEQYYLLFPPLLAALWRFGVPVVAAVLASLVLAGIGAAEVWVRKDAAAAFYLLPTRGWTILLGALAAIVVARGGRRQMDMLALTGVVMILSAVFGLDTSIQFPGVWALLPTVGAALVLVYAGPTTVRVLGARPLVWLGLISYGLYLWHNPVMAFVRYGREAEPAPWVMAGTVLLTGVMAALSWVVVEQPFRKPGTIWHRRAVPMVVAGSFGLIVLGVALVVAKGLPARYDATTLAILAAEDDRNPQRRVCSSNGARVISPNDACMLGGPSPVMGAVIGDSHADALSVPLSAALTARNASMAQYTYSGCPMLPGLTQVGATDSRCDSYTEMIFAYLADQPDLGTVIVHARFALYLAGAGFDNGEGGVEDVPAAPFDAVGAPIPRAEADRQLAVAEAYRAGIDRLLAMGKRVIVITSVPEAGWNVPRHMAFAHLRGDGLAPTTARAIVDARLQPSLLALIPDPVPQDLIVIRPDDLLCDAETDGRCILSMGGIPLYADGDHLTNRGAGLIVDMITPYLPGP